MREHRAPMSSVCNLFLLSFWCLKSAADLIHVHDYPCTIPILFPCIHANKQDQHCSLERCQREIKHLGGRNDLLDHRSVVLSESLQAKQLGQSSGGQAGVWLSGLAWSCTYSALKASLPWEGDKNTTKGVRTGLSKEGKCWVQTQLPCRCPIFKCKEELGLGTMWDAVLDQY